MAGAYTVLNTTVDDLPVIFQLFEESIRYQEKKGFPVWKNYDKDAILRDIDNGHQYKIVTDDGIQIVFSIAYRDPLIWRDRDCGDAVYLHRIVVNPLAKGRRLFGCIVEWALSHVRQLGLKHLRMDTWADNPRIISYYKTFGFEAVENYTTPDTDALPVHNRNLKLTLMEYSPAAGQ